MVKNQISVLLNNQQDIDYLYLLNNQILGQHKNLIFVLPNNLILETIKNLI